MAKLSASDFKLSVREVIGICFFLFSLAGVYYKMQSDIDKQKIEVQSLKSKLDESIGKYNLELINYKLNEVNAKTDRVLHLLDKQR